MKLPTGSVKESLRVIDAKGFIAFCKIHYGPTFEISSFWESSVGLQVQSAKYSVFTLNEKEIEKQEKFELSRNDLLMIATKYLETLGVNVAVGDIRLMAEKIHTPGDSREPLDYGTSVTKMTKIYF